MNQRAFTILEVIVIGALVVFVMYIGGAFKGTDPAPTATRAQPSPAPTLTAANSGSDSSWFVAGGTVYEVGTAQPKPASSGTLIWSFSGPYPSPIATRRPTATPAVTLTPPPPTTPTGLIAFESTRDGNSEIYVVDVASGVQTNLTNNPAEDYAPVWSPDGNRIAFLSTRTGWLEIFAMNADGSGLVQVSHTFGRNIAYQPFITWSPDGKHILAIGNRVWSGSDYHPLGTLDLLQSNGTKTVTLSKEEDRYYWMPAWSPDGKFVAVNLERQQGCYIYVGQFINQQLDLRSTNEPCGPLFVWLPDSGGLLFTSGYNFFTFKPDGSDKQQLKGIILADADSLSFSPDNQYLAAINRYISNTRRVHLFRMGEVSQLDLSKNVEPGYHSQISWSPDNQWITYSTTQDDMYIVNIYDSERPIRLTETGDNFSPQWQP